jgi:hypothetical protein
MSVQAIMKKHGICKARVYQILNRAKMEAVE